VLWGVPVGELGTQLVGTPLDLARPPGVDVQDGAKTSSGDCSTVYDVE
jgi:hypothetical protein